MRLELFYNPFLLIERLDQWRSKYQRLKVLKGTVAENLSLGHIDSLELLNFIRSSHPCVVYDIGANIGTWTLLAKALYPNTHIHCFEPLPKHIEKFRMMTKGIPDIYLHEVGLGSSSGIVTMKVTDFSDASSLLPLTDIGKQEWHLSQVNEIPLQIECLDEWVASHELPNPDLIKLDVQGFELEVLRGGKSCLKHAQWVLLEVSFDVFYQGQCSFDQIVGFMAEAGFYIKAFGKETPLGRRLLQTDVLFQRVL